MKTPCSPSLAFGGLLLTAILPARAFEPLPAASPASPSPAAPRASPPRIVSPALPKPAATPASPPRTVPPALPPPAVTTPVTVADPNVLKWDADSKDMIPKPGELSVSSNFTVTNVSDHDVLITKLRTSCGCTVAQLPSTPYKLEPNANVSIAVTLDVRGKFGLLTKTVTVDTSAGTKSLIVRANLPPATAGTTPGAPGAAPVASAAVAGVPGAPVAAAGAPPPAAAANATGDRAMNIQNALADRQAIFKGDCATCHVEKGVGKLGADLYMASCGICHEAEHRAAMVPDLNVPRSPRDLAFWQKWIAEGKPGTLMPAFAAAQGGPLTQEQADSLTVYLYQFFPRNPPDAVILTPVPTVTNPSKPEVAHENAPIPTPQ